VPNNSDSDLCQSFSYILQYIPSDTAQNKPLVMSIESEVHRTLRGSITNTLDGRVLSTMRVACTDLIGLCNFLVIRHVVLLEVVQHNSYLMTCS
jgi:hypothetical protein